MSTDDFIGENEFDISLIRDGRYNGEEPVKEEETEINSEVLKRSRRDYDNFFKLRVVDEIERGELSYLQAQKQYGIQGKSTVLVWLRKYGRLDWTSPKAHKQLRKKEMSAEKRIQVLEAELKKEKSRTRIYETIFGTLQNEQDI